MAIPFISVRHPRPHDLVDDPVEVAGAGTGFEGTLQLRLRNHAGAEFCQELGIRTGAASDFEHAEARANPALERGVRLLALPLERVAGGECVIRRGEGQP